MSNCYPTDNSFQMDLFSVTSTVKFVRKIMTSVGILGAHESNAGTSLDRNHGLNYL